MMKVSLLLTFLLLASLVALVILFSKDQPQGLVENLPRRAANHISPTSFAASDRTKATKPDDEMAQDPAPILPTFLKILDDDGRLSYAAVRKLGLTTEQARQSQTIFSGMRKSISEAALETLTLDEENCDIENGITAYTVEPFPDAYEQIVHLARTNIAKLIGDQRKSDFLIAGVLGSDEFRIWSTNRVRIRFEPQLDQSFVMASLQFEDPMSGDVISSGLERLDVRPTFGSETIFAHLFDLVDPQLDLIGRSRDDLP